MKKLIIFTSIFVVGLVVWLLFLRCQSGSQTVEFNGQSAPRKSTYGQILEKAQSIKPSVSYEQFKGGKSTGLKDPRWQKMETLETVDPGWQGRIKISFYGKVEDEQGQPVADAEIKFVWTDLSAKGTSERGTKSDQQGLFSLTGVKGKFLVVYVSKSGYENINSKNRYDFEYAAFWSDFFFEPDSSKPVVFVLRKRLELEPLIHKERRVDLQVSQVNVIHLDSKTKLHIILLDDYSENETWQVQVSVVNGGIQLNTEEQPVLAPLDGYVESLKITSQTPKPVNWRQQYIGGRFYVKGADWYGRLELRMMLGKTFLRYESFINPSGSRNLEYDSDKPYVQQP